MSFQTASPLSWSRATFLTGQHSRLSFLEVTNWYDAAIPHGSDLGPNHPCYHHPAVGNPENEARRCYASSCGSLGSKTHNVAAYAVSTTAIIVHHAFPRDDPLHNLPKVLFTSFLGHALLSPSGSNSRLVQTGRNGHRTGDQTNRVSPASMHTAMMWYRPAQSTPQEHTPPTVAVTIRGTRCSCETDHLEVMPPYYSPH